MEMAALTGLERIAVIAGALVVGFWGYRMMGRERVPGLVFMGISCLVLGVVLITGNQRLSDAASIAVTSGADAATRSRQETRTVATPEASTELADAVGPVAVAPAANAGPASSESGAAETAAIEPASALEGAPETSRASAAGTTSATAALDTPDTRNDLGADLLSGQELGGRIVSIKSENVTLEWTPQREE